MGYYIAIGNAEIRLQEYYEPLDSMDVFVDPIKIEESYPLVFRRSDGSDVTFTDSAICPSYSGWHEILKSAGIVGVFTGSSIKMNNITGCKKITTGFIDTLKDSANNIRLSGVQPSLKYNDIKSNALAYVEWMVWWCEWAIKNCDTPAIYIG